MLCLVWVLVWILPGVAALSAGRFGIGGFGVGWVMMWGGFPGYLRLCGLV